MDMRPDDTDPLNALKMLSIDEIDMFTSTGGLPLELADKMRENVIGVIKIPLGVAQGLTVNGKPYTVPIATEERTVITITEIGAKLAAEGGGFKASTTGNVMIGQIQVIDVPDINKAAENVLAEKQGLLADANTVSRTRKAVDVRVKQLSTAVGPMLIVEVLVDVRDSMGANLVDTICELLAPTVERLTGGHVNMRILTNLATERLVTVETTIPTEAIGPTTVDRVVEAYAFAEADPYRAATHNKGLMNGIIGVLMATCNDTRAVEAGAHSYAALSGRYQPLTTWSKNSDGDLHGVLTMPLSVATVGGVIHTHELARLVLRVLDVSTASELAMVAGSVGLAANLGALYTLVTDGIKSIQP